MKRIKTIRLMGHKVEVVSVAPNAMPESAEAIWVGGYPHRIIINGASPFPLSQLILHESCHGVLHLSGISELLDGKLEEAIVTAFEHAFSPYIKL